MPGQNAGGVSLGSRRQFLQVARQAVMGFMFLGADRTNAQTMSTNSITLHVGNQAFTATLFDNPSAVAIWERLPLTVDMEELNGNEKFVYLSSDLPAAESAVGRIEAGDIMLYGRNCLVIFYASFTTSYRYTKLGRIDQPKGLAAALGTGKVLVRFDR